MGFIADRNRQLAEVLDAIDAQSTPVKPKAPKKKKKRTRTSQFSVAEIEAMSLDDFSKLTQD